jgi:hypothetical protein
MLRMNYVDRAGDILENRINNGLKKVSVPFLEINMRILFSYILLFIVLIILPSCRNNDEQNNSGSKQKNTKTITASSERADGGDEMPEYSSLFTPLTEQKFQDVRDADDQFTDIYIVWDRRLNPDSRGIPQLICRLYLYAGNMLNLNSYDLVDNYEGNYITDDDTIPLTNEINHIFTKLEIDSIFDYLELNADYFFNNAEYNGAATHLSSGEMMCNGNYTFTLMIGDPLFLNNSWQEQYYPSWAISKCIDEYPAPEHPLYGLFQILENDFIDEFE